MLVIKRLTISLMVGTALLGCEPTGKKSSTDATSSGSSAVTATSKGATPAVQSGSPIQSGGTELKDPRIRQIFLDTSIGTFQGTVPENSPEAPAIISLTAAVSGDLGFRLTENDAKNISSATLMNDRMATIKSDSCPNAAVCKLNAAASSLPSNGSPMTFYVRTVDKAAFTRMITVLVIPKAVVAAAAPTPAPYVYATPTPAPYVYATPTPAPYVYATPPPAAVPAPVVTSASCKVNQSEGIYSPLKMKVRIGAAAYPAGNTDGFISYVAALPSLESCPTMSPLSWSVVEVPYSEYFYVYDNWTKNPLQNRYYITFTLDAANMGTGKDEISALRVDSAFPQKTNKCIPGRGCSVSIEFNGDTYRHQQNGGYGEVGKIKFTVYADKLDMQGKNPEQYVIFVRLP